MTIYLDYASTTPVDPNVLKEMQPYFNKKFGNPSSQHSHGSIAKEAIEKSRNIIAKKLNTQPEDIIFTSGATESNNTVLKSNNYKHIIVSSIEHDSIINTCKSLKNKITYLPVDSQGNVNPEELIINITKDTALVSIAHANNELGTIQPIKKISKICKDNNILFHTDAVQSFGKIPIPIENIDFLSISAHKIYGPKGIGVFYVKEKVKPLLHGGNQEQGLRSGTENTPAIVGFAKAVELLNFADYEKISNLEKYLSENILNIKKSWINKSKNKLHNILNIGFENVIGEDIVKHLDHKGISLSTGSACSSNKIKTSHVLDAIGLRKKAKNCIRVSLGIQTTKKELDILIKELNEIVPALQKI